MTNTDANIMREADKDSRRHMEWSTKGGPVLLSYPAAMTADDVDDVEALFAMTIRILRRRSGAEGAL